MNTLKNNNIRHLNVNNLEAMNDAKQWLSVRDIKDIDSMTKKYSEIYQKHHINNKWILMINPENSSLESMENVSKNTFSKILRVNSNKVNVRIENIETALRKGNCSAVIINNASFSDDELALLYSSAKEGNTQCMILNNKEVIH